jgi:hypothetical protein
MAKELPYFKFFVSEWSDGDITLEDYNVQGIFISLCSYYWSKECKITLTKAQKKFKDIDVKIFDILKESKIIKIIDGNIIINFLDEQRSDRNIKTLTNRVNGAKGGRPKNPIKNELKPKNNPVGYDSDSETKAKQKAIREEKRRKEKKREYAEFVFLLEKEYETLCNKYNKKGADSCIETLNNYKGSLGKKYKSDYMAINSWVVNKLNLGDITIPRKPKLQC